MDTIMYNTTDIDNRLPKGLRKLLNSTLDGYAIQSWRISGEDNLLVSIRFSERPTIAASTPMPNLGQGVTHERVFRSKPPSAVTRDTARQQAWLTSSNQDHSGSGFNHNSVGDSASGFDMFTNLRGAYQCNPPLVESGFISCAADVADIPSNICNIGINTNEAQSKARSDVRYEGKCDIFKDIVSDTNVCDTAVQTVQMSSSSSAQTDEYMVHQSSFSSQFPPVKKKFSQTVKIPTDTKQFQTDQIKRINQSTAIDMGNDTRSIDIMTEYPFTADKATTTLPPIGRHIQTDDTNYMLKRNGKSFKKVSTQCDYVQFGQKASIDNIQLLKTSMANEIAEKALNIKYHMSIGNVT